MAFLKLRDQVGEGRRGGIAPTGEGGTEEGRGGRAGQRCGPPGRPLSGVAAREAGCRPGDGRAAREPPGAAGDPPVSEARAGGSPRAAGGLAAAAARGAGPALAAWAPASGALPGVRLPAR